MNQAIDSTQTGWLRLFGATKRNSEAVTTGQGGVPSWSTGDTHGIFGKTNTTGSSMGGKILTGTRATGWLKLSSTCARWY